MVVAAGSTRQGTMDRSASFIDGEMKGRPSRCAFRQTKNVFKGSKATSRNMAHHFRRLLRPVMFTQPNECGQGNGNDAAGEGGRRGNRAINRGALHQGPNHPEVLFSAFALLHQITL